MNNNIIYNFQFYDFELSENKYKKIDITMDSSEYYDYDLGENTTDYISRKVYLVTYYILTENGLILSTEDTYRLRYI